MYEYRPFRKLVLYRVRVSEMADGGVRAVTHFPMLELTHNLAIFAAVIAPENRSIAVHLDNFPARL